MENIDSKASDDNSGHVSKFIKLSQDSISKINKEENLVKKMDHDICEITEKITEKMSKIDELDSALNRLKYSYRERRNREVRNEKLQRELYMTLDELNVMIKAANGEWFGEKLDKNSLNSLKLHGSKSLAKEKQILRDIKIQQKDVASFKSPSHLLINSSFAFNINKLTYNRDDKMFWWTVENLEQIRRKFYLSDEQKLLLEIEQCRIQHLERASSNDSFIVNISKYESLKKSIEDKIKVVCDDSLRNSREWMECGCGTRIRYDVKEKEALIKEIYSLIAKLQVKHKKKDEAFLRILKLKKLYNEELGEEKDVAVLDDEMSSLQILHYYQYCAHMNKVHQPDEEKNTATLDEMSSLEVGKFMLEWNNNKAFREDYEKRVLLSLERRQLSKHRRRRPDKSCS